MSVTSHNRYSDLPCMPSLFCPGRLQPLDTVLGEYGAEAQGGDWVFLDSCVRDHYLVKPRLERHSTTIAGRAKHCGRFLVVTFKML